MQTKNIFDVISQSKTIAIFSHIRADGDAVGSIMAFCNYCLAANKQVFVFLQEPISANFNFLGIQKVANKKHLSSYDLAICVDCPTFDRFGVYQNEAKKAKFVVCIDHHLGAENFGDINIVQQDKSSTCEIIFDLFEQNNQQITPQIATCLYAGIAADTGRFMHSNTKCSSFLCAGKLVELGADLQLVNDKLFNKKSFVEFDIFRKALNNIEFFENGKIAFVGIESNLLKQANATYNDTFLIIDFVKGIENVDIAVLMTEYKHNEQMVSVRTNKSSAQNICKHFGGGGHLKASGCRVFVPFKLAKEQMIEQCIKELKND